MRARSASALLIFAIACAPEKVKKPIYIGMALPQSGALVTGDLYTNSANLALKHIVEAGGIRGDYALTLAQKDTGTTAAGAGQAITDLIAEKSIKASLVVTSAETIAVDPVAGVIGAGPTAAAAKVPLLCIGCSAPDFESVGIQQCVFGATASGAAPTCTAFPPVSNSATDVPGYLYRTLENSAPQGAALAQMALGDGRVRHAGVAVNLAFGTALIGLAYKPTVEGAMKQYVRTVTHEQSPAALAKKNMVASVTQVEFQDSIKASYDAAVADGPSGAVDALVVNTFPDYDKIIATAYQASPKKPALYFSFTAYSSEILASSAALLGAKGVNYLIAGGESPGTFVADYASIGNVPEDQVRNSLYIDGAYDAVMLIALAIYATGEENPSPEAVKAKLDTLNDPAGEHVGYKEFARAKKILDAGGTINYDGVSSKIEWSDNKVNGVKSPLGKWEVIQDGTNLTFKTLP